MFEGLLSKFMEYLTKQYLTFVSHFTVSRVLPVILSCFILEAIEINFYSKDEEIEVQKEDK